MRNSAAKDVKGHSPERRNGTKERPLKGERPAVAKRSPSPSAPVKSRPGVKTAAKGAVASNAAKKTVKPANGRGSKSMSVTPAAGKAKVAAVKTPAKAVTGKGAPKPAAAPAARAKAPAKAPKPAERTVAKPAARSAAPSRGAKAAPAPPAKAPARSAKLDVPSLAVVVKAFETALKAFHKGNFKVAREGFESIIERFPHHTDIIARVNMYLTICRNRTAPAPYQPQTADSLYDRGVVELNNWNYDLAVTYFERALKGQSSAPHIFYSLAAAQVRLGKVDEGLHNLERAIAVRDMYRSQARRDPDFAALRTEPRFQELVGILYEADAY